MNIQTVNIEQIKPYWRNPRNNEKAIDAVKESIKKYGYNSPIVVDKGNVIIAGHTRYKALLELDYKDIPVVVLDIPDDKAKQYRIADNKTAEKSEWDENLLMFELREIEELQDMVSFFDNGELDDLLDLNNDFDMNDFEDQPAPIPQPVQAGSEAVSQVGVNPFVNEVNEQERQKEIERNNQVISQEQEEVNNRFSDISSKRHEDLVTIACPHCGENMILSKSELLRKAKAGY